MANERTMRIIVHDYAGHPFEVQLSRELAARGHDVLHLYCGSTPTPRGDLARRGDDPGSFAIRGVGLSQTIPKTSFFAPIPLGVGVRTEITGGMRRIPTRSDSLGQYTFCTRIPPGAWCQHRDVRLVSWIQDIYGLAASRLLRRKLPFVGHAVGRYFIALDKWAARHSVGLVLISDDYRKVFASWGVDSSRPHVIHNWAALESMPVRPRDNRWSRAQLLGHGLRFIYAGTLAMKHNPALLLELARARPGLPRRIDRCLGGSGS